MRVFHYTLVGREEGRLIFKAYASKPISAAISAAGVIMLGIVPVIEMTGVSDFVSPAFTAFIIFPAFGLILGGGLLLFYSAETVIETDLRQIHYFERLAWLPVRKLHWRMEEFKDLIPSVVQSGREGKTDTYAVIILKGRRDLPLLDVEDYHESVLLCRELKAAIGL